MIIPYGLTADDICAAVKLTEEYFASLSSLRATNRPHLLDMLPANAISGLVSDIMIHSLCTVCSALVKNSLPGGYPDLLNREAYSSTAAQAGISGIEVKSSKNAAWQGHNPESGWLMALDYRTLPETNSVEIKAIYLALLEKEHWTFCPRGQNSRRTPTAKVNRLGMKTLKASVVYDRGG